MVGARQDFYQRKEYPKAKEILRDVLLLESSHGLAKELMARVSFEARGSFQSCGAICGSRLLKEGSPTEAVRVLEEPLELDAHNEQASFQRRSKGLSEKNSFARGLRFIWRSARET